MRGTAVGGPVGTASWIRKVDRVTAPARLFPGACSGQAPVRRSDSSGLARAEEDA
jgi:hypothetical protein